LRRIRVSRSGDNHDRTLHRDVVENMHTGRCRCQFDSTLFVVDRDDVLQLYRHQPTPNDFEGNPVHRKPRSIMYWMYSAAVTPPYDMLNGFLLVATSVGTGLGVAAFFALLAGGEDAGFLATAVSASATSAVDGSLRPLDHESTSFRSCAFIASACLSASRCASSSWPSGGFVILNASLVQEENHKSGRMFDEAHVRLGCGWQT
jgi:hypothetical protein